MHRVEYFSGNRELDSVVKATQEKEGCKIKGEFHLHFLSNNFFVGFGNQILMAQVMAKNPAFKMGLSHHINSLTFGPNGSIEALSKKFDLKGFNTLNNHRQSEDRQDGYEGPFYHSYYLIGVPNIFDRMFGRILETFQYTASAYAKRSSSPAIVFV